MNFKSKVKGFGLFRNVKIYFFIFLSISLSVQMIYSQELDIIEQKKRKVSINLDEIKVLWKKTALERCPFSPCIISPPQTFTCGTSTVSDIDGNL
jgi:hypothetical protein